MVRESALSLRTFTLSSVTWYASVPVGWALILLAIYRVIAAVGHIEQLAAFVMTAGLLIILELLPLVSGRGHDPQGVVMSTAFLCAMLFVWGVWPAIVCVGIASLAADLRADKQLVEGALQPRAVRHLGRRCVSAHLLPARAAEPGALPAASRPWRPRLDPTGLGQLLRRQQRHRVLRTHLRGPAPGASAGRLRPRRPDVVLGHGDLADHRRRGHALVARAAPAPDPAAAALLHQLDVSRTRTRCGARRPDRPAQPQHAPLRTRHGPGRVRTGRRPVRPDAHRHGRLQARQRHAGTPGRRPAARRVRRAAARAGAPG